MKPALTEYELRTLCAPEPCRPDADIVARQEHAAFIDLMYRALNPREYRLLEQRFGLNGSPCTFRVLADQYGITRAGIQQAQVRALRKLRRNNFRKLLIEAAPFPIKRGRRQRVFYTPIWELHTKKRGREAKRLKWEYFGQKWQLAAQEKARAEAKRFIPTPIPQVVEQAPTFIVRSAWSPPPLPPPLPPRAVLKPPPPIPAYEATVTIAQCAELLQLSMGQTYAAIHDGSIPSFRIDGCIRVPTAGLSRLMLWRIRGDGG